MFPIRSLSFSSDRPGSTPSKERQRGESLSRMLQGLKAGEVGIISQVASNGGSAKRLADLGFVRGVRLEMIRPGIPCIVRIGERCVGLGRAHQASIQLSVLQDQWL